jgi:hypothetical protein
VTPAACDQISAADAHWVYAALVVFGRMVVFVNFYPTFYKSKIMRGDSGNVRSNPFIYRQIGDKASDNAIIFDEEGDVSARGGGHHAQTPSCKPTRARAVCAKDSLR